MGYYSLQMVDGQYGRCATTPRFLPYILKDTAYQSGKGIVKNAPEPNL